MDSLNAAVVERRAVTSGQKHTHVQPFKVLAHFQHELLRPLSALRQPVVRAVGLGQRQQRDGGGGEREQPADVLRRLILASYWVVLRGYAPFRPPRVRISAAPCGSIARWGQNRAKCYQHCCLRRSTWVHRRSWTCLVCISQLGLKVNV